MPNFKYEGRDQSGSFVSGTRTADSSDNLSQLLFNEGITPINIILQSEQSQVLQPFNKLFKSKRVDVNELALFTRQMYTLIRTGVLISVAVRELSISARTPRMAEVLLQVAERMEAGQNMASAMRHFPEIFSPLMIAMIEIGENSGRLDDAFLRLSGYLELEGSTLKKIKATLRYPMFVVGAIFIGVIIINIFVIPTFAKVYKNANIPLPWVTRVLINTSNFFVEYWLYLLIFAIILFITIVRYLRTPAGKYKWHKFQFKIPIVGYLLRRMILLRFSETFSIVFESGIPIVQGLELVADSINNQYAHAEILNMKDAIQRGSNLLQAATGCELFTRLELQMLAISEKTGELGVLLNEIARYYQREVEYDLKHLTDMIEPLLLTLMAVMVLFLALAVYLPIWSMVKLVHG